METWESRSARGTLSGMEINILVIALSATTTQTYIKTTKLRPIRINNPPLSPLPLLLPPRPSSLQIIIKMPLPPRKLSRLIPGAPKSLLQLGDQLMVKQFVGLEVQDGVFGRVAQEAGCAEDFHVSFFL